MLIIYWFVFISGVSFSVFYPELEASAAAPALNRTRHSNPAAPAATIGPTFPLLVVVLIVVLYVVVVIGISKNIYLIMT